MSYTIAAPSNARYVRFSASISSGDVYTTWQFKQSTVPSRTNSVPVISVGETSKNLFDESKYKLLTQYNIVSGRAYSYATIKLKPNTTYKVSVRRYNGFDGKGKGYLLISNIEGINGNWTAIAHETSDTSQTNYLYTTGANGILYIGYLVSTMTQQKLDYIWKNTDVQIEEGESATPYVPYSYVDVESSGKNLFGNFNTFNEFKTLGVFTRAIYGSESYNQSELTFSNNNIKITGSGSRLSLRFGNLKPNTNYTFSCYSTPFGGRIYAFFGSGFYYTSFQDGRYIFNFTTDSSGIYSYAGTSNDKNQFQVAGDFITIPQGGITLYNFQLEEGSNATTYEPYKNPVTNRIDLTGYEPLRKIGNVADYIDYKNQRIVRNIGKKVFDGSEAWDLYSSLSGRLYTMEISDAVYSSSIPVLTNKYLGKISGGGSSYTDDNVAWFQSVDSYKRFYINDFTNGTTTGDFRTYLINQYNAGTPLIVYYILNTPKYEPIDLPKIPIASGTGVISVKDNKLGQIGIKADYPYNEE